MRCAHIEDVLREMERRYRALDRAADFRAVFARSYLTTTEHVYAATRRPGVFRDPEWVARIDCAFAERYFRAWDAFAAGADCPEPWAIAFRAALDGGTAVLQDILLGMNAHISLDLPYSLDDTIEPDASPERLALRHADHETLNEVLAEAVDAVQRDAAWAYDPALAAADILLGSVDERLASRFIRYLRNRVWEEYLLLRAAREPGLRRLVERNIESAAIDTAHLLLEPQRILPRMRTPLRIYRRSVCYARRAWRMVLPAR